MERKKERERLKISYEYEKNETQWRVGLELLTEFFFKNFQKIKEESQKYEIQKTKD